MELDELTDFNFLGLIQANIIEGAVSEMEQGLPRFALQQSLPAGAATLCISPIPGGSAEVSMASSAPGLCLIFVFLPHPAWELG